METSFADVLIVGAGPSGSVTALVLAQFGHDVCLVERNTRPGTRVCGEFLSPECEDTLRKLGLWRSFMDQQPGELHRVRIFHAGHMWQRSLPRPAYCLTREALDAMLFDRARAAGARALLGHEAVAVHRDPARWQVRVVERGTREEKLLTARVLVMAGGIKQPGRLPAPDTAAPEPWIAFQAHGTGLDLDATLEMYFFAHGYLGLASVDGARINLCGLMDVAPMPVPRPGPPLLEPFRDAHPRFRERIRDLVLPARFRTCSPLPFGRVRPVRAGVLCVGDAAGSVHPFCGDGVAMALEGARLLAEQVHEFLVGRITREQLQDRYRSRWRREFARRVRFSRVLEFVRRHEVFCRVVGRILTYWPAGLDRIIQQTRGGVA